MLKGGEFEEMVSGGSGEKAERGRRPSQSQLIIKGYNSLYIFMRTSDVLVKTKTEN